MWLIERSIEKISCIMDLKIIIFCFVLHYNKGFCLKYEVIDTVDQFYTVTTDQQHTDKQTLFYTESTPKKTRERIKKKLLFLRREHICKTLPDTKLFLCEELLQVYDNGFTFGSSKGSLECTKKSYTILFLTLAKSTVTTLSTFDCPQVFYTDLETGEQMTVPYTYKFSTGRTHNSAIFFVLRDTDSNDLYPQKYVQNIHFKQMKMSGEFLGKQAELSRDGNDGITESYLQQKYTNSPYDKFKQFFPSINVCGLRRAAKIYLCKLGLEAAIKYPVLKFDFLDYFEAGCKKYSVVQRKPAGRIDNNRRSQELYMIRCPPLSEDFIPHTSKPESILLYYIASNLSNRSITLFVRLNDKNESPTQKVDVNRLKMRPILQHISRERFLPMPFERNTQNPGLRKSYQEIEDEINAPGGDVRAPSTLKRFVEPGGTQTSEIGNVLKTTFDRRLADHVLISFSKVKMTKSIYTRFMITHKSLDICDLTALQRTLLCNSALEDLRLANEKYLFTPSPWFTCARRKVTLTALEADDYETNQFSMLLCYSERRFHDLYFLGKNHLKDSATIYKKVRLGGKAHYYPQTLITKINRSKLVEILWKFKPRIGK